MNEYTRREEIRWTLVTVALLVPAVAIAIARLVLVEGPWVPDQTAIAVGRDARRRAADFAVCVKAADKLEKEVPAFKSVAELAKRKAEEARAAERERERPRRPRADGERPVEVQIPWSAAALVHGEAQKLAPCQEHTTAATGVRPQAVPAWKAVAEAARMTPPQGGARAQESKAANSLLELFASAPLDALRRHTADAQKRLDEEAASKESLAATHRVRQPIPDGLFPRSVAIGVGVGVSLAALVVSYASVRSVSRRRGRVLVGLRHLANAPNGGLQAAAIVRLAAHHNGGEPGMVLGSALGGLLAAVVVPLLGNDLFVGDLFVAGSMGGLLFGLAAQWLVRTVSGVNPWRRRAMELGALEKPTIPIALVLDGVKPGLEKAFLRYFDSLTMGDAASVVQKLAAQTEEQILAAAEAGAQQRAAMMANAWPGHQAAAYPPGYAAPMGTAPGSMGRPG